MFLVEFMFYNLQLNCPSADSKLLLKILLLSWGIPWLYHQVSCPKFCPCHPNKKKSTYSNFRKSIGTYVIIICYKSGHSWWPNKNLLMLRNCIHSIIWSIVKGKAIYSQIQATMGKTLLQENW